METGIKIPLRQGMERGREKFWEREGIFRLRPAPLTPPLCSLPSTLHAGSGFVVGTVFSFLLACFVRIATDFSSYTVMCLSTPSPLVAPIMWLSPLPLSVSVVLVDTSCSPHRCAAASFILYTSLTITSTFVSFL
ncbi:hypothetical protein PIB30_062045 [Stylosanthes scabra]|uniref:Uncharacterized protein n=1 Tax=Stylosanthes scabra TaxID=79078 RepID=A0ABU6QKX3_9FABA|nr:hypothetical protein [Stylosanthes scabra]